MNTTRPPVSGPLQLPNVQKVSMGALDPSLVHDQKTKSVWMAYTSQERSRNEGNSVLLHVRLARVQAGKCERWMPTEGGFEGREDDILAPDGQTVLRSGSWRLETPTLVHDPDDPGREWKLYAYKYFWAKDPRHTLQVAQHYGMIVYKYATDPAKDWSTEQWLFSPAPDYPPPPYESMVLLHLNSLDSTLREVVAYARPSAVYKDGVLVMILSAFVGGTTPDRIIMIVSGDHGNSWKYTGTVLQKSDLEGLGPYTRLAGATLLEKGGQVYLAVVVGDEKRRGVDTLILSFDGFAKGLLRRDAKTGSPVVLNRVLPVTPVQGNVGMGFSAYTEACSLGMLTSEQASTANFQIFKTYKNLIPD